MATEIVDLSKIVIFHSHGTAYQRVCMYIYIYIYDWGFSAIPHLFPMYLDHYTGWIVHIPIMAYNVLVDNPARN